MMNETNNKNNLIQTVQEFVQIITYWTKRYYKEAKFGLRKIATSPFLTSLTHKLSTIIYVLTRTTQKALSTFLRILTRTFSFAHAHLSILLLTLTIPLTILISNYSYAIHNPTPLLQNDFVSPLNIQSQESYAFIPHSQTSIPMSTVDAVTDSVFLILQDTEDYTFPLSPVKFVEDYTHYTFICDTIDQKLIYNLDDTLKELKAMQLRITRTWMNKGIMEPHVSISVLSSQRAETVSVYIDDDGIVHKYQRQVKEM